MRTVFILAVAAATMLSRGALGETIRIGVSAPLTGDSISMGISIEQGAELAVSRINRARGILGYQVELIARDDEAKPDRAVEIAGELINQQHVAATIGFVNTDVALAAQPLYQAANVPVLNIAAAGSRIPVQFQPPDYPANYIFQMAVSNSMEAAAIVQEALTRRGFKAPALLTEETTDGQEGRAALKQALTEAATGLAMDETFRPGDRDMTTPLARARQANADVILVFGLPRDLAVLANSMGRLGWKLPIMGNSALATATFVNLSGLNGEGASMPEIFLQRGDTGQHVGFIAEYLRTFKVYGIAASGPAALGFDSVYLLKAAIEQAKSTDGPKIREALEDLGTKVEGLVTTYDRPFTSKDHNAATADLLEFAMIRNGFIVAAHER